MIPLLTLYCAQDSLFTNIEKGMVIYMKKTAIGFIGFGLIGGSIAKALKKLEKDSYYFIIFDRY